MASMWPPKKNTAFTLYFTLYKSDGTVIANPGTMTRAVSIDGGAVDTTPANAITEEDTTYGQISWVLSADEMNGDAIWVYAKDDTSGCVPFTCTLYTAANTQDEIGTNVASILADTGTDGVVLAADAITAAKIADNAIAAEHIADDAIVAANLATGCITADAFAADAIVAATLATDAITDDAIATGAIASTAFAAGAINAAAIAADAIDADALKADAVTEIQSGLSTLDAAGIRTAVGLSTANLDTQLAALPTAAENADAVWDEASTGHTDAGKAGQQLWTDVDAILADTDELQGNQGDWATATGFSTHAAADVWSVATRTITALDEDSTTIDIDTAVAAGAPAASAIADAVWNEALADHLGAGSTGNALNAAGSAGDPWATALPGAYGAGSAGLLLGTTIPNAIDAVDNYVDTEVGALATELAKVPKSDSNVSWNATALAAIQSEATDALSAYDPPTATELTNGLSALKDFDPATDVVAHVTLVDTTTTNTDMVAAAPAAADVADAVWDEALAGHAGAGSAGAALSAASAPSAATVADAVWDEALSGHAGAGSAGAALSAAGTAGDPWSIDIPGAYADGTAGQKLGDIMDDLEDGGRTDLLIDAIKAQTDALDGYTVTVVSPVADSGTVTLYAGDDYDDAHGRALTFSLAVSGVPDLTAATVVMKTQESSWTATSCTSDGTDWIVLFEPTAADTAALGNLRQTYEVEATLSDGDVATLATGTLVVARDVA